MGQMVGNNRPKPGIGDFRYIEGKGDHLKIIRLLSVRDKIRSRKGTFPFPFFPAALLLTPHCSGKYT